MFHSIHQKLVVSQLIATCKHRTFEVVITLFYSINTSVITASALYQSINKSKSCMYPAYAASLAFFFFLCAWLTTNVIKVCISFC